MAAEDDVKQRQIIENRARNISHNVLCTECGSQSIEDSQADVAILFRKVLTFKLEWLVCKTHSNRVIFCHFLAGLVRFADIVMCSFLCFVATFQPLLWSKVRITSWISNFLVFTLFIIAQCSCVGWHHLLFPISIILHSFTLTNWVNFSSWLENREGVEGGVCVFGSVYDSFFFY